MKILQLRNHYSTYDTTAAVLIDGVSFGHCLEDPVRFTPKEYGITAIPAGLYLIKVTYSPRFKRDMVAILNVPNFSGIRIHGGNDAKHSLGCPLYAKNKGRHKNGRSWIQGSLERTLTARVKKAEARGEKNYIEIINTREV